MIPIAVTRHDFQRGSFVASWPMTISQEDLIRAIAWINAVLGAWIERSDSTADQRAALLAAEDEYASWLATPADLEFASWGTARKAGLFPAATAASGPSAASKGGGLGAGLPTQRGEL